MTDASPPSSRGRILVVDAQRNVRAITTNLLHAEGYTVLEAVSTSNATTGNLFRYDATSGQYVFNLNTKTLSAGSYQLRLDLGDGVTRTVGISLW